MITIILSDGIYTQYRSAIVTSGAELKYECCGRKYHCHKLVDLVRVFKTVFILLFMAGCLHLTETSMSFDVRNSVRHHTIQINQPTTCNNFTSLLLDVYVWLNMFQASPRPSSAAYNCTRSLWYLPDHDQQRSNRPSLTVIPEAPSAVICS